MIVNSRIFIECFEGNKIDEMISIINELIERKFEINIFYRKDIDVFSEYFDLSKVNIITEKNAQYDELLYSSKYIIVNTNIFRNRRLKKREGQILVQLWHGVPYKKINNDIMGPDDGQKEYIDNFNYELSQTDYLLIPNDFCEDVFKQAFTINPETKLLKMGYPRNDLLNLNNEDSIRLKLKLPNDKKIVLYAPTFDDKEQWGTFRFKENFANLIAELQDTHHFILSFHPGTHNILNFEANSDNYIINTNSSIPTVELFKVADVLITDFSSTMFDYAITGKPVINYFTKEQYQCYQERRGSYMDMEKENFNLAFNLDQLKDKLSNIESINNAWTEKFAPLRDENSALRLLDEIKLPKFPTKFSTIVFVSIYCNYPQGGVNAYRKTMRKMFMEQFGLNVYEMGTDFYNDEKQPWMIDYNDKNKAKEFIKSLPDNTLFIFTEVWRFDVLQREFFWELSRFRIVLDCHAAFLNVMVKNWYKNEYKETMKRWSIDNKNVDFIHVSTQKDAEDAKKMDLAIPHKSIYNPMDMPDAIIKPKNKNKAIFVGRITEKEKGIISLLENWKIVNEKNPNLELYVYGDGDDIDQAREIAKTNKNIKIMGMEKNKDVMFADAAYLISNSPNEGFPFVFLEAINYETIVLCPQHLTYNESTGYDYSGFNSVEELGDKINQLITDDEFYKNLQRTGKNHFEQFKYQNIAVKWNDVLLSNEKYIGKRIKRSFNFRLKNKIRKLIKK